MPTYTGKDIANLASRMAGKSETVNAASALAINKASTFAISESVKIITKEVTLTPRYVKARIDRPKKASPTDLEAVVSTVIRATLLSRFEYVKSGKGYRVRVNRSEGFRELPTANRVRLRGSGEMVLAMFNKEYLKTLKKGGPASKAAKKLAAVEKAAKNKPYGRYPLTAKSLYQLFDSARGELEFPVRRFMQREFLKDFNRLSL